MKKHGVFFGFAVLLITAIFTLTGCDGGGDPKLAKWKGTWNAMAEYLDDTGLNQAWTNGASYVNTSLSRTDVTADQIKTVFKTMLKTDFKSCVIDGDTMKIYAALDVAGSPSDTITYTYKGTIGEGDEAWYSFEGNKAGDYKYLIALAVEPGSDAAAEHFHFRYGPSSFDALTADDMGMWMATVMKQGTTIPVLAASLETVIEELPWQYIIAPAPEMAEWAGTWNAIDQYLDDQALDQIWTDAVTAITTAEPSAAVDAATLKGMFKQMLKTDFKSCIIEGNTMKIYSDPDATGSPTATWTYTYSGIHTVAGEEEDQEWSKFTGDKEGQFKYLVMGPQHEDAPGAMLHFHLQYSGTSFEDATGDNPNWVATVTPTTTTIEQIAGEIAAFPWAMYASMFVPQNN